MPILPPDVLSLTHEEQAGLLVCRWRPDAPSEELSLVFDALLQAALGADKCRFWLFDMRERAWHPPVLDKWFERLLSQQVVQVLGKPVFLACVATEQNKADIEGIAMQVRLRAQAQHEFYPYFFADEAAAREWLRYYQGLEGR
ncbi:hypothetical protein GCM10027422_26980 [Hymenobacter arcticus]